VFFEKKKLGFLGVKVLTNYETICIVFLLSLLIISSIFLGHLTFEVVGSTKVLVLGILYSSLKLNTNFDDLSMNHSQFLIIYSMKDIFEIFGFPLNELPSFTVKYWFPVFSLKMNQRANNDI